jgi:hypothetical protein
MGKVASMLEAEEFASHRHVHFRQRHHIPEIENIISAFIIARFFL